MNWEPSSHSSKVISFINLSPGERGYAITELETLAVAWAVGYFHLYLYGNEVTVYTDHRAVKAVMETPSANGKHARGSRCSAVG